MAQVDQNPVESKTEHLVDEADLRRQSQKYPTSLMQDDQLLANTQNLEELLEETR